MEKEPRWSNPKGGSMKFFKNIYFNLRNFCFCLRYPLQRRKVGSTSIKPYRPKFDFKIPFIFAAFLAGLFGLLLFLLLYYEPAIKVIDIDNEGRQITETIRL